MRINTITIDGNLTRSPARKYTNSGKELWFFCIAHNKAFKINDEWKEDTSFINVKTWKNPQVDKGDPVVVTGEFSATKSERGLWVEIMAKSVMPIKKIINQADQNNDDMKFYGSATDYETPEDNPDNVPF